MAVVGGCWRLLTVVGGCWRLLLLLASTAGARIEQSLLKYLEEQLV
jgi:hypothetical protein